MCAQLVSYPDPSTSQLRMDYITATLELSSSVAVMYTCDVLGSGYETSAQLLLCRSPRISPRAYGARARDVS